jgi:hypothetical protein
MKGEEVAGNDNLHHMGDARRPGLQPRSSRRCRRILGAAFAVALIGSVAAVAPGLVAGASLSAAPASVTCLVTSRANGFTLTLGAAGQTKASDDRWTVRFVDPNGNVTNGTAARIQGRPPVHDDTVFILKYQYSQAGLLPGQSARLVASVVNRKGQLLGTARATVRWQLTGAPQVVGYLLRGSAVVPGSGFGQGAGLLRNEKVLLTARVGEDLPVTLLIDGRAVGTGQGGVVAYDWTPSSLGSDVISAQVAGGGVATMTVSVLGTGAGIPG